MEKSLSTQKPSLFKASPVRRFMVKRIDLPSLFLTKGERDFLLKEIDSGKRFVQLSEETIAMSSITSISQVMSDQEAEKELKMKQVFKEMKKKFTEGVL